jgi:alpha-L-rhamnosidase
MYSMLKKRECPGYLYMIDNGAYTTWEYWNGIKSQIHNCYNGIGSWFYQALAGICPDEKQPGYRHTYIKPQPVSGIDWVKAAKNTPYGKLAVEWKKEDGKFIITINIPVGSTATICLPDGTHSPTLPSGHHTLSCSI